MIEKSGISERQSVNRSQTKSQKSLDEAASEEKGFLE